MMPKDEGPNNDGRARARRWKVLCKVVSGGQTGVDQLALRAAKTAGFETGGWAPPGFLTSNGRNPALLRDTYGLKPIPVKRGTGAGYSYVMRTQRNVEESDATLVFLGSDPALQRSGTAKTAYFATHAKWPAGNAKFPTIAAGEQVDTTSYLATEYHIPTTFRPGFVVILPDDDDDDNDDEEEEEAGEDHALMVEQVRAFLDKHQVKTLNVAGHRQSPVNQPNYLANVQRFLERLFERE